MWVYGVRLCTVTSSVAKEVARGSFGVGLVSVSSLISGGVLPGVEMPWFTIHAFNVFVIQGLFV